MLSSRFLITNAVVYDIFVCTAAAAAAVVGDVAVGLLFFYFLPVDIPVFSP
jgi:hypothetical protein